MTCSITASWHTEHRPSCASFYVTSSTLLSSYGAVHLSALSWPSLLCNAAFASVSLSSHLLLLVTCLLLCLMWWALALWLSANNNFLHNIHTFPHRNFTFKAIELNFLFAKMKSSGFSTEGISVWWCLGHEPTQCCFGHLPLLAD